MVRLIQASAHELPMIPDGSVHCIATSPPYYGLRTYAGEQDVEWPTVEYAPMAGLPMAQIEAMSCGLGREPTIEAFVGHLVLCLREWWRVLRDDGTLWVNLGDSYANDGKWGGATGGKHTKGLHGQGGVGRGKKTTGLKPKDLMMIPARFALAAQADGWFLRSDLIWHKPNAMPESVTDRPSKAHEYIFLLTKSERYFYDADAISEDSSLASRGNRRAFRGGGAYTGGHSFNNSEPKPNVVAGNDGKPAGRNSRSVWTFATQAFPDAHFATFPEALPERAILAGTSAAGWAAACRAPWRRIIQRRTDWAQRKAAGEPMRHGQAGAAACGAGPFKPAKVKQHDWQPTCTCPPADPIPCTVLDPFNGSGTTGRVALRLGRDYIGVDLSAEYLDQLTPARLTVQPGLRGLA